MRATSFTGATVAALVVTAWLAASAAAGPYTLGSDVKVNGGSTLNGCPFGASPDFAAAYDNAEVEPQVAVNPTNPAQIVGVSQQDRWPDGGARGLTSWRSTNGGASWAKLPDVPWSACQGGPMRFGRVTDPWVSYDKAGNLYFIGQPIDSAALGISAISVTSWNGTLVAAAADPDRGRGQPRRLQRQGLGHRRPDARRLRVRHVAAVHCIRPRAPTARSRTSTRSRSGVSRCSRGRPTAGGRGRRRCRCASRTRTSRATRSPWPPTARSTTSPRTCSGARVAGGNATYMSVSRSNDAGLHWSSPVQIAPINFVQLFVPDDNFPIRAEDYLPDIAISPTNGDIYVVWADGLGTPINKVVMVKSTDGGRHWSGPTVVSTQGGRTCRRTTTRSR